MDLNELKGRVLRVNLARPSKLPIQGAGNKASTSIACALFYLASEFILEF